MSFTFYAVIKCQTLFYLRRQKLLSAKKKQCVFVWLGCSIVGTNRFEISIHSAMLTMSDENLTLENIRISIENNENGKYVAC